VPNTLSELSANGVDVLGCGSSHHTAVIQHALDRPAKSIGKVLYARPARQGPSNRTYERAAKDCSLRFPEVAGASHNK